MAVREFDGANAKGQPIRLTILPLAPKPRRDNPFDKAENPKSIFDRVETGNGRGRGRSQSPVDDDRYDSRNSSRRLARGAPRSDRRTDPARHTPENVDRYTPGEGRRGGRRPGERRERPPRSEGRPGARPKKTAEELDAEMDDYFANAKDTNGGAATETRKSVNDDDIDMVT